MLTSTFIHAQGIGETTEKRIWQAGAYDWYTFIELQNDLGLSDRQKSLLLPVVEESIEKFEAEDYTYFARRLPSREHWRVFNELSDHAAYLDIETTGMMHSNSITLIGIYDGRSTKTFVKGFNIEEFIDEIEKYPLLITYSGAIFDLPQLRYAFPNARLDQLHIDLCPTLRKLGYKGGLKSIEHQLGLKRTDNVDGLDGWDAVRLWYEWESGSRESLDRLIEYNRADVENLKHLAEFAYKGLKNICFNGLNALPLR